jgi:transaldolase/glucose-6-phosphate isomerase
MIKVPATLEGIAAVEELTAEGINVNITLMFSLEHYEAVAQAYLRGIDRHPDPSRVVSVVSERSNAATTERLKPGHCR